MNKRNRNLIFFAITVAFGILLLTGATLTTAGLTKAPQYITNNFGENSSSQHNFTWETSLEIKTGGIEYCLKDQFSGFEKSNISKIVSTNYLDYTDVGNREIHKVEVGNLQAGKEYVYRVGSKGFFSSQGTFRTSGIDKSGFTFINITDTQGSNTKDYSIWKNTLDMALAKFPNTRFLVHSGDMVDDGQLINQWDMFTGAVSKEIINLPIAPVVGNHEVLNKNNTNTNEKNFVDRFDLPNEIDTGAPLGTVYSFDYGDAHIVIMNTQCSSANLVKQGKWLRSDLKASNKKWKIVALHRGPYGSTYDSTDIRKAWVPIFDEQGVDLVLEGHDHNYQRSYFLENGLAVKSGKGTLYINSNTGGVKFYPIKYRSWQALDIQPKVQMYLAISVKSDSMKIEAYDVKNILRDSITLQK